MLLQCTHRNYKIATNLVHNVSSWDSLTLDVTDHSFSQQLSFYESTHHLQHIIVKMMNYSTQMSGDNMPCKKARKQRTLCSGFKPQLHVVRYISLQHILKWIHTWYDVCVKLRSHLCILFSKCSYACKNFEGAKQESQKSNETSSKVEPARNSYI